MMRAIFVRFALAFACAASSVEAQARAGSLVNQVLSEARRAMDDLNYRQAIARALSVVSSPAASRSERVEALMIAAAAYYPGDEASLQRPDSAMVYLRQLVRLSPDQRIPDAIGWAGLDSLLERTRRTTFAATAAPRAEYRLTGGEPVAGIRVLAASRARFRLQVERERPARTVVVLDSTALEQEAILRLRLLDGDRRLVPDGEWTLVVTATDSVRSDSIRLRYPVTVSGSALTLDPVPAALDSAKFVPEWAAPRRGMHVGIGIAMAAVTVGLATGVSGEEPVASASGADVRAFAVAAGIVGGAVYAALRDPGRPLPANAAQNQRLVEDFRRQVAGIQEENARRRAAFTATITIGEVLP